MRIDVLHKLPAVLYSLQKERKTRVSLLRSINAQKSTKIIKINIVSSNVFFKMGCRTILETYPDLKASHSI